MLFTHKEQVAYGTKLVAVAGKWAEAKGFELKKSVYAKTFAAAVSAVQDGGPDMLTFDEMRELINKLAEATLALRMAEQVYDIPIAVTVLDGKVYGAYTGTWQPYELATYDPAVAALAIEMGLFQPERDGEIGGKPVKWWTNRYRYAELGGET